ncbi:hypothetical protein O7600_25085 [Micromonospora sp. WMMA1998]|uniref:hypothetical protein n=1 Tax=Micromonospora sp. WMMA1998 TaxID=3015167 RepID=UPI00248C2EF2|nr:hypothetical protein [Micromonospora sp. WMMA1998]WBC14344.1 hypothetical protein O7600_25085 [Micromonospora sp. WMMA1998]
MALSDRPAERHQQVSGGFTDRVRGTRSWDAPAPALGWTARDAVQSLLGDPATAGRLLSNPHVGELPLDRAIDQFYTSDVFMHTWDLARATG